MPFDAAGSDWRGGPTPGPRPIPSPRNSWLLKHLKGLAFAFAAVSLALFIGMIAGAAVDGFPILRHVAPNLHPQSGSVLAQAVSIGSFLCVVAGVIWWRVHRNMAK